MLCLPATADIASAVRQCAIVGTVVIALRIAAVVTMAGQQYEMLPALNAASGILVWTATRATQLRAEREPPRDVPIDRQVAGARFFRSARRV